MVMNPFVSALIGISCTILVEADPRAAAGGIVQGELGARIDDYLRRLVPFGFSGAIVVAQEGNTILEQGFGFADREKKAAVTPDTVFDIGSITKQFTAAAILKLEMQGKLNVQDSITKFFKDLPSDKSGITLHHLLTHASGLEGDFGGDYDGMSRDGIIEAAMKSKLRWEPGTRYAYANAGYSLLGAVVELVSGQSYESYLRENLFLPAGMQKTGYRLPSWDHSALARGYHKGTDHGTPLDHAWAEDGPFWNLRANGGVLSTVGDMYRWHVALSGETVLSNAAKEKMFTPHIAEGPHARSHYGYGWSILETPRGTRLITHDGGSDFGFHADFRRYVDERIVVFIASNGDMSAIDVDRQVARILFGMEFNMPPKAVEVHSTILATYAGTYETTTGAKLVVTADERQLHVMGGDQAALSLLGGADTDRQGVYDRLNERSGVILEALIKNNYQPIHTALGIQRTLEETRARYEGNRSALEARHGPLRSADVLGSMPGEQGIVTGVRLVFERGSEGIQLLWEEDRLMGIRHSAVDFSLTFVPESMTEFASFRLAAPPLPQISFRLSGHGGTSFMTIKSPKSSAGDVIAKKIQ